MPNSGTGVLFSLISILLGTTNKMQCYKILFIIVNALHVSGGFSAHHQELKNCTHSIWYVPGLLAANISVVELERSYNSTADGRGSHPTHVEH
jgi:hypothetical protein